MLQMYTIRSSIVECLQSDLKAADVLLNPFISCNISDICNYPVCTNNISDTCLQCLCDNSGVFFEDEKEEFIKRPVCTNYTFQQIHTLQNQNNKMNKMKKT